MKLDKEKIILVGGGGHCKSCIDVIEQEGIYDIAGIVDFAEKYGEEILGYKIIAQDDDIPELAQNYKNFLVTVGQIKSSELRTTIYNLLKRHNVHLPVLKSPIAYVSDHAKIGEGTIVMHHAIVNANAVIGSNCIINTKALIEHDAIIGDHCHISTASIVNGGVKIGSGSFFGSGAVSNQSTNIPINSFIKANSIVK